VVSIHGQTSAVPGLAFVTCYYGGSRFRSRGCFTSGFGVDGISGSSHRGALPVPIIVTALQFTSGFGHAIVSRFTSSSGDRVPKFARFHSHYGGSRGRLS